MEAPQLNPDGFTQKEGEKQTEHRHVCSLSFVMSCAALGLCQQEVVAG